MPLSLFKKKNIPKTVEEDREETPASSSETQDTEKEQKISPEIELERLKTQMQALMETRKVTDERLRTMTEQIGELRSAVISKEREIKELRVKAERAMDIVDEVQPEKLDMSIKREDGKVQALKDMILANEQRTSELEKQISELRKTVKMFKGTEQILKLNEEISKELQNLQKMKSIVEGHADKVENMFIEVQKNFAEFRKFKEIADTSQQSVQSLQNSISELKKRISKTVAKKDLIEAEKTITEKTKTIENTLAKTKKYTEFLSHVNVQERLFELEQKLAQFSRSLEASSTFFDDITNNIKSLKNESEENNQLIKQNEQRIIRLLALIEEITKKTLSIP
jgi:chromosome segregation ATPase